MVAKPVGHEIMDVSNMSQCYSQNCKKDTKLKDIRKLPNPIELVCAKMGKNCDLSSPYGFIPICLLLLRA